MSAQIIPFPKSAKQPTKEFDPFEEALVEMEERLGVSVSDYLGFSGNPKKTKKIVERNMNRETLKILTDHSYNR
ncbi:hypothetical protein MF628_005288 [Paenibacillus polymyxa]|uniref:hypothetical protein n=1 Tax=Paenibacillus polymyxa TaxID=1406 RepID=UPI00202453F9|nr:hypothetical protein [Paenibacillus polymyxa]URJ45464.3 hypothetical protein MF628_005288 [Paenibacillus polymyxa]